MLSNLGGQGSTVFCKLEEMRSKMHGKGDITLK